MIRQQTWIAVAVLALAVTGCDRGTDSEVHVERVPKEQPAVAENQPAAALVSPQAGQREEVDWDVPAGWTRRPGGEQQLRYATFQVSAEDPNAVVTVVPLGAEAGSLLENVRRWQGQLGLKPAEEADLNRIVTGVDTVNGGKAEVVDLTDVAEGKTAMLAAILKHGGATWFYKLTGPKDLVARERSKFTAFTKSTKFGAGGGDEQAQPGGQQASLPPGHPWPPDQAQQESAQGGDAAGAIQANAPAGWTLQPAKPMRDATYLIGDGDKRAEVVVSHFPQGVGDFVSNVNRWRQQVGLGPVQEADPKTLGMAVTVGGVQGQLYDFAGPATASPRMRQMVAVCNRNGMDWFFKIIGPADVVESNKQPFVTFLGSVHFNP